MQYVRIQGKALLASALPNNPLTYTTFNQKVLSISSNTDIWRQHFLDDFCHGGC